MQIGTKRVVLVVEDDPSLQKILRRHLTELDFEVRIAVDYHAAIRAFDEKKPDIACIDLTLPRESGYELCEYVRRTPELLNLPIIVLGDRGSPEEMAHAEEVGANAFLKKPFTVERLTKYVSTLLDGPNASRPSVRRLRRS